jgi:hypothetical protein
MPDLVERRQRHPLIMAVFSFRYDHHLVPGMLKNIATMVDGWVSFDDRDSAEVFSDEPARRHALVTAAKQAGADWILAIDPDERFERGLARRIRELTRGNDYVAWSFPLRELYAPHAYRVDGVWGLKAQARLFRVPREISPSPMPLHSPWHAVAPGIEVRVTDLNLYHLKMIAPARRQARRDLYKHLDPDQKLQAIGYDYLADEEGIELENIPIQRFYDPPFVEDHGLWMPEVPGR